MQRTILATCMLQLLACWNIVDAQLIVAHRGASHDAPENTLAAFELAWERQADAIEGDFYLTKDEQIACLHDRTTKRVAPRQKVLTVADSTMEELRTLDVGSWKHPRYAGERIPTIEQVLKAVPAGKQIFVEIKCGPEILPPLAKALQASNLKPNQIIIICFHKDVIVKARRMMPQYRANWLTSYKQQNGRWKPSLDDVLKTLKQTDATGLGSNQNMDVLSKAFVNAVKAGGWETHVWTVNSARNARRCRDLKVMSVTTDLPASTRRDIESKVPAASLP